MAGIAVSGLQPPGSTFKMVTLTAALEAKAAKPRPVYPVPDRPTLEGVHLENANGESCGGTLVQLVRELVQLGLRPARRQDRRRKLVTTAERFGFNHAPGVPGVAESTIPPAEQDRR